MSRLVEVLLSCTPWRRHQEAHLLPVGHAVVELHEVCVRLGRCGRVLPCRFRPEAGEDPLWVLPAGLDQARSGPCGQAGLRGPAAGLRVDERNTEKHRVVGREAAEHGRRRRGVDARPQQRRGQGAPRTRRLRKPRGCRRPPPRRFCPPRPCPVVADATTRSSNEPTGPGPGLHHRIPRPGLHRGVPRLRRRGGSQRRCGCRRRRRLGLGSTARSTEHSKRHHNTETEQPGLAQEDAQHTLRPRSRAARSARGPDHPASSYVANIGIKPDTNLS